jgi:hypothetical protein
MIAVGMVGAGACGGEDLGTLQVMLRLESPNGGARSCADFGAQAVELSFYADPGDLVPLDRATVDCEATAAGRATFALSVAAQSYHRVVLRLVTEVGDTVRICGAEGRQDAVLEVLQVSVSTAVIETLSYLIVGDALPCAE